MSRNTLSDKKEIVRIFRRGRRWRGVFFTLITSKQTQKKGSFVVSIAKKSLPSAADRNIVRRRAQNILKKRFSEEKSNFDCIAQFNAKNVKEYRKIEQDLIRLLNNIKQN